MIGKKKKSFEGVFFLPEDSIRYLEDNDQDRHSCWGWTRARAWGEQVYMDLREDDVLMNELKSWKWGSEWSWKVKKRFPWDHSHRSCGIWVTCWGVLGFKTGRARLVALRLKGVEWIWGERTKRMIGWKIHRDLIFPLNMLFLSFEGFKSQWTQTGRFLEVMMKNHLEQSPLLVLLH